MSQVPFFRGQKVEKGGGGSGYGNRGILARISSQGTMPHLNAKNRVLVNFVIKKWHSWHCTRDQRPFQHGIRGKSGFLGKK